MKILNLKAVQEFSEENIECKFEIEDKFKIKFNVANYDLNQVLKINIQFLFEAVKSSKVIDEEKYVVMDNNCIYITGVTSIKKFPEKISYKSIYFEKDYSTYIIKIDTGKIGQSALEYVAYFGGSGSDSFHSVDIDYNNYVYVTGSTKSKDFPITNGEYEKDIHDSLDRAFLVKFDVTKSGKGGVLYSSYLI